MYSLSQLEKKSGITPSNSGKSGTQVLAKFWVIPEGHEQPAILDAQVAMLEYWSQTVRTPALVLEVFTQDQQFILDRLLVGKSCLS